MKVVIHESVFSSWAKDFGSIAAMVFGVALNNWIVGGSTFLNGFFVVLFILFILAKFGNGKEVATNREDAIRLIDKAFPPGQGES